MEEALRFEAWSQLCQAQHAAHSKCLTNAWHVQAVKAVADSIQAHKVSTLVVDPVLVATSGDSLAGSEVAEALKSHLFPLATIVTPNLPEASALLGNRRVSDLETMKQARICTRNRCHYMSSVLHS